MERQAAVERTKWVIDCTKALSGSIIAGPMHSQLGHFIADEQPELVAALIEALPTAERAVWATGPRIGAQNAASG